MKTIIFEKPPREWELRVKGIILGCTEISMRVSERHACAPLFDTTARHAAAAVAKA